MRAIESQVKRSQKFRTLPFAMEGISLKLPREMLDAIDNIVQIGLYPNRSEFIREAIRILLRIIKEKYGIDPFTRR